MSGQNPYQNSTATLAQQQAGTGQANQAAAQGTLGQYEGPAQNSPFYKTMLTSGLQNTANQYQSAKANQLSQAKNAGFGYASPNTQAATSGLATQEAGALAGVPNQALTAAGQMGLQAAGQTANMGNAQVGQGLQGYGSAGQMWQNAQNSGLWQTLAKMGTNAGASFGGGAGTMIGI